MTFKDFASAAYHLPATAWRWTLRLIIGDYQDLEEGEVERKTFPGLLGLALNLVAFVGRSITDFMTSNRTAIATAFWASLTVGGGLALTAFMWPAALTLLANFSVYGFSIASLVGTGFIPQIAAIGAVGAVGASALTYATAAVVGVVNFFASCFKKTPTDDASPQNDAPSSDEDSPEDEVASEEVAAEQSSYSNALGKLGGSPEKKDTKDENAPIHAASPAPRSPAKSPRKDAEPALVAEDANRPTAAA